MLSHGSPVAAQLDAVGHPRRDRLGRRGPGAEFNPLHRQGLSRARAQRWKNLSFPGAEETGSCPGSLFCANEDCSERSRGRCLELALLEYRLKAPSTYHISARRWWPEPPKWGNAGVEVSRSRAASFRNLLRLVKTICSGISSPKI